MGRPQLMLQSCSPSAVLTNEQSQFCSFGYPVVLPGPQLSEACNVGFSRSTVFFHCYHCYYHHVNILPACISVQHLCAWSLWRSKSGIRSPGTPIAGACDPLCRCWKLAPSLCKSSQCLKPLVEPSLHPTPRPTPELLMFLENLEIHVFQMSTH